MNKAILIWILLIFLVGCSEETKPQVNNLEEWQGGLTEINGSACKNWEVFGDFILNNKTIYLEHNFYNLSELRSYCDVSIDPYSHVCESSKLNEELGSKNFTFVWLNCTEKGEDFYTREKLQINV